MSVTFFAIDADGQLNNQVAPHEINVSNLHGAKIQMAIGLEYDNRDQPSGEMTLDEFVAALAHGYRQVGDDGLREYLHLLNDLWGHAVDANAHKICWA